MTKLPVFVKPELPPLHVEVKFGSGIEPDLQGQALLMLERFLRVQGGVNAEVFKETMTDDSKLRSNMTPEERAKL